MTRRKNYNRSRQQEIDKTPVNFKSPVSRIKDFNNDSCEESRLVLEHRTPKSIYYINEKEIDRNHSTPGEFLIPYEDDFFHKKSSPDFAPRVPRLKLNLDIPEDLDHVSDGFSKDPVDKQLTEKCVPTSKIQGSENKKGLFRKSSDSVDVNTKEMNEMNKQKSQEINEMNKQKSQDINEKNKQNSQKIKDEDLTSEELIIPGTEKLKEVTNIKWSGRQILKQLDLDKICSPRSSSNKLKNDEISVSIAKEFNLQKSDGTSLSSRELRSSLDKEKGEILKSVSAIEFKSADDISGRQVKDLIKRKGFLIEENFQKRKFETIIALPQKNVYTMSTLKPHCTLFRQSLQIFKKLKIRFPKVTDVCSWISKRISNFIKQIRSNTTQNLNSFFIPKSNSNPAESKKCDEILSALQCESEKIVTILSEKITHLSEELKQVRATNEASITSFAKEITSIRDVNVKLVENSLELVKELKSLHQTLKNIQLPTNSLSTPFPSLAPTFPVSTTSLPVLAPSLTVSAPYLPVSVSSISTTSLPTPSLPVSTIAPPPPPPPPPLPISLFQDSKISKTPKTPNSGKRQKSKTPKKPLSAPVNRPSITVDDLLKVTLKKAPRISKENRRNTVPGPKGPVISMDMLRSVKLRSARSESNDLRTKSSKSHSVFPDNLSNSIPKMSPISTKSESPLSSILKQVDVNRPRRRKILTCPTPSDNDLINATATSQNRFRLNRSHSLV